MSTTNSQELTAPLIPSIISESATDPPGETAKPIFPLSWLRTRAKEALKFCSDDLTIGMTLFSLRFSFLWLKSHAEEWLNSSSDHDDDDVLKYLVVAIYINKLFVSNFVRVLMHALNAANLLDPIIKENNQKYIDKLNLRYIYLTYIVQAMLALLNMIVILSTSKNKEKDYIQFAINYGSSFVLLGSKTIENANKRLQECYLFSNSGGQYTRYGKVQVIPECLTFFCYIGIILLSKKLPKSESLFKPFHFTLASFLIQSVSLAISHLVIKKTKENHSESSPQQDDFSDFTLGDPRQVACQTTPLKLEERYNDWIYGLFDPILNILCLLVAFFPGKDAKKISLLLLIADNIADFFQKVQRISRNKLKNELIKFSHQIYENGRLEKDWQTLRDQCYRYDRHFLLKSLLFPIILPFVVADLFSFNNYYDPIKLTILVFNLMIRVFWNLQIIRCCVLFFATKTQLDQLKHHFADFNITGTEAVEQFDKPGTQENIQKCIKKINYLLRHVTGNQRIEGVSFSNEIPLNIRWFVLFDNLRKTNLSIFLESDAVNNIISPKQTIKHLLYMKLVGCLALIAVFFLCHYKAPDHRILISLLLDSIISLLTLKKTGEMADRGFEFFSELPQAVYEVARLKSQLKTPEPPDQNSKEEETSWLPQAADGYEETKTECLSRCPQ